MGRCVRARLQRQHFERAEALIERCDETRQGLGLVDDGDGGARGRHARHEPGPEIEIRLRHGVRAGLQRVRSNGSRIEAVVGRVRHHVVEALLCQAEHFEPGRREPHLARNDAHALGKPIAAHVLDGDGGQRRLLLEKHDLGRRHAPGEAQSRGADPGTHVEDAHWPRRHGGRQHHRVEAGAVARFGLQDLQHTAEKSIVRQLVFGLGCSGSVGHRTIHWPRPASSRRRRAAAQLSSGTASRF